MRMRPSTSFTRDYSDLKTYELMVPKHKTKVIAQSSLFFVFDLFYCCIFAILNVIDNRLLLVMYWCKN